MGKVMFMKKGEVHTAPAPAIYLMDNNGNVVVASSETEKQESK